MKLTLYRLCTLHAPTSQIDLFCYLFPEGEGELTEELCVEYSNDLDWSWLSLFLLDKEQLSRYKKHADAVLHKHSEQQHVFLSQIRRDLARLFYHVAEGNVP